MLTASVKPEYVVLSLILPSRRSQLQKEKTRCLVMTQATQLQEQLYAYMQKTQILPWQTS